MEISCIYTGGTRAESDTVNKRTKEQYREREDDSK